MSIFFRNLAPKQIGSAFRFISTAQARCHYWYPDLKPGPYPKTKEEREAAAKKYNLLPEEYEPYPEDSDEALGDYPKLPFDSVDSKDPLFPWDHQELQRNYGEPVPFRIMNLMPEALSTAPPPISHKKGTLIFLGMVLSTLSFALLLDKIKIITPVMEQQLVTPGVTHYTFNLEKGSKKGKHHKGHKENDKKSQKSQHKTHEKKK